MRKKGNYILDTVAVSGQPSVGIRWNSGGLRGIRRIKDIVFIETIWAAIWGLPMGKAISYLVDNEHTLENI